MFQESELKKVVRKGLDNDFGDDSNSNKSQGQIRGFTKHTRLVLI
jgi:hypothetical protein